MELVDNRAAIAYFAVFNRNDCLFEALKSFIDKELHEIDTVKKGGSNDKVIENEEDKENKKKEGHQLKMQMALKNKDPKQKKMEEIFKKMLY